MRDQN